MSEAQEIMIDALTRTIASLKSEIADLKEEVLNASLGYVNALSKGKSRQYKAQLMDKVSGKCMGCGVESERPLCDGCLNKGKIRRTGIQPNAIAISKGIGNRTIEKLNDLNKIKAMPVGEYVNGNEKGARVPMLLRKGLVSVDGGHIRLTEKGREFLEGIKKEESK